MSNPYRNERDSLGEVQVPVQALWGAQTERARANFAVSGRGPHPRFLEAGILLKKAAARANRATGRLDPRLEGAIVAAADEVLAGQHRDQFVVDIFQAGAGTSHNMNLNEVLANRANELLGAERGTYTPVHPNDHVNMAQSTNDTIPTTIRLASRALLTELLPSLAHLYNAFYAKGKEFDGVLKSGRTHLQDATPIRLGQEFTAYGAAIHRAAQRIEAATAAVQELGIGGTAVGTGLNAEPAYIEAVVKELSQLTGFPYRRAKDAVHLMQSMGDLVALSATLRGLCVELGRIANDLRLLSSGPTTGLAEIALPPVQPGSSIMPGKVNPVMAEMINQVCYHVMGNDTAVTLAAGAGQLELNVMMPVLGYNLIESLEILSTASRLFADRCVSGITADEARCREYMEASMGLPTALTDYIGYAAAAQVAKESLASGQTVREVVLAKGLLSQAELERILAPANMTEPGVPGRERPQSSS